MKVVRDVTISEDADHVKESVGLEDKIIGVR